MPDVPWSRDEVEAIVADYLDMLVDELRARAYNKAAHRRALLPRLRGRSVGAVENKRQNVSAVLIDLGFPWIRGYKPLFNYQALLAEIVSQRLAGRFDVVDLVSSQVEAPAPHAPHVETILSTERDKPAMGDAVDGAGEGLWRAGRPRVDYLAREARNRSLGDAGERFVIQFERARLASCGKDALADRVEHTAKVRGDHEGFDVLSFEEDGRERLIEVKTTRYAAEAPFYVTENEVRTSRERRTHYQLYRVYDFGYVKGPHLYRLEGDLSASCLLRPQSYVGRPR